METFVKILSFFHISLMFCLNSISNFAVRGVSTLVEMLDPHAMLCVGDKMAATRGRRSVLHL